MGHAFSSNQLSGAVSNGVPTISYAFATTDTKALGFDGVYTATTTGTYGYVTAYLVQPTAAAQIQCNSIPIDDYATSIDCPISNTALVAGLYTLSFSQYSSTYDPAQSTDVKAGTTLQAVAGDVTFSVVPQPTTTVTPTVTVSTTQTSGTLDVTPSTVTIPSSTATSTSYSTTSVSVSTSTSTLTGFKYSTSTLPCPTTTAKTSTTMVCNHDNCLRAFLAQTASATPFCSAYTSSPSPKPSIPSWAANCGATPSRISSACACVVTSPVHARDFNSPMEERGYAVMYGPPSYTFLPGQYTSRTYYPTTSTVTVTAATVPSTTTTDPAATSTSGVSTIVTNAATVSTSVYVTTVDSRSASTITVSATGCASTV